MLEFVREQEIMGFLLLCPIVLKMDKPIKFIFMLLAYLLILVIQFYLVHQNIGYAFIYRSYALGLSPYWGIALAFLVATCLASALTYLIEKPAIKYLRASQLPLTFSHWLTRKWNLLTSR